MFAISLPDLIPDIDVVGMVEGVLKKAVEVLFGDPLSELGGEVLRVLLVYPDLATSEEFAELREAVAQLRTPSLLLLAAFTLMGFVRGLGLDGPDGGVDVVRRFFVGFFGIWFWSYLFSKGIAGANLFLEGLVELPAVEETIGAGLTTSFAAGGPLGLLFAPLLGVLALILLGVKIAMTAMLALVFGLGTLAFAAYPFEPLSHLTGTLFQTLGACLALPAVWTVELVVFAGVGKGALVFSGADLAEELTAPLVAGTLLVMMIMTPFALLRWASMRGLLPTLQGGLSAAYYGSQVGRMVGVGAVGAQASGLLAQAAAPPPPGGSGPAASAPSMGFDPPPRGPSGDFDAGQLAPGEGDGHVGTARSTPLGSEGERSAGTALAATQLWPADHPAESPSREPSPGDPTSAAPSGLPGSEGTHGQASPAPSAPAPGSAADAADGAPPVRGSGGSGSTASELSAFSPPAAGPPRGPSIGQTVVRSQNGGASNARSSAPGGAPLSGPDAGPAVHRDAGSSHASLPAPIPAPPASVAMPASEAVASNPPTAATDPSPSPVVDPVADIVEPVEDTS